VLIVLAFDYLRDNMGATPIRFVELRTGAAGLLLLVAALACTPVNLVFGWRGATQIRRALGLYAFLYIAIHLLAYALFDGELDTALIWRDLQERRAMPVGLLAFVALVPLALTSTSGWQRRLGKRWRILHWLMYLAVPLSVLHFFWLDRDIKDAPLRYAVVVAVLLAIRLRPVRRAVVRLRQRGAASALGAPPSDPPAPGEAEDRARPAG
jgi:sulfoxide reductase heme-binding subunit YedZ